jgi:hypothetical protein
MWCRDRDYAGHDPFDGLNSRLFQLSPLQFSRTARLAWIQLFKRSPISPRRIAAVPVARNAKGLALFALAALARFRTTRLADDEQEARKLLNDLVLLRVDGASGASGAAWGYNFDWQNRAFLAPRGTPTIVATAFAVRAFSEAAQTLHDSSYARVVDSSCNFVLNDLKVTAETSDEICWSYSPLDQTRVFNASLLAAELLASGGAQSGDPELKELAMRGARYVVRRQRADGSWAYGEEGFQSWADNFHTAFILTSLSRIIDACGQRAMDEFGAAVKRGYDFWINSFFAEDGWPKYYPDRLYPADAHSVGAALAAFAELQWLDSASLQHAEAVANWAFARLRDPGGFFYYQRRRFYTVRTPYMRWSQAWMLYGLARVIERRSEGQS